MWFLGFGGYHAGGDAKWCGHYGNHTGGGDWGGMGGVGPHRLAGQSVLEHRTLRHEGPRGMDLA